MGDSNREGGIIRFGVFELDLRAGELRKSGARIKLQDQPFQILRLLLERPGEVITREEIQQKLWPGDTNVEFEASVNAAVMRLRHALGDSADNPQFVETLPRRGYRFIYPVEGQQVYRPTPTPSKTAVLGGAALVLAMLLTTLVGLNVGGLRDWLTGGVAPGDITSIAVLPLENLSGDPEQDYFADGMTDALINELGKISALRVISRQSVMQFKGTELSLPEIAKKLGVDAIVEGTALQVATEVRITAQLIRAVPEQQLWSESYQRDMEEVLKLQSQVARTIVDEIRITMTAAEETRFVGSRSVEPDAYLAYLKGEQELNKDTQDGYQEAIIHFKEAVRLQPDFADGFAGLAEAYNRRGEWWGDLSPGEARPVAREYAQQALQLDPNNGPARAVLARILWTFDWVWDAAEEGLIEALELIPNSPDLHRTYANYLRWRGGREEAALSHVLIGQSLDPLHPMGLAELALHYGTTGRLELAYETARKAIETDEDSPAGYFSLGTLHLNNGEPAKAVEVLEKANSLPDNPPPNLRSLGVAYAMMGRRDDALRIISKLRSYPSPQSFHISFLYAVLGDEEMVIDYLEKAYEERHPSIVWLKDIPKLQLPPRIRKPIDNPRWQAVYRKMNFPPSENAEQAED